MSVDRQQFRLSRFVGAVLIGMAALAASVVAGVDFAVDRAVSADARARAEDWAGYFINRLPDVDALLKSGRLTDSQQQVVTTAAHVGNVFRFKLYDASGHTIVESDAQSFGKADDADHVDDEVGDVVKDRQPMISLNDGTRERNMPALYAEGYVPVLKADGSLRAVVETYVDETRTAAFFKTSFNLLAIVLSVGISLAFGVPTIAFLLRTKQAREVKSRADFLASHDALTSLPNRQTFAAAVAHRAAELPAGLVTGVALLDVDDFLAISDEHGRQAGDEFLKRAASAIAAGCLVDDIAARGGDDQFLVLLSRPTEAELLASVEAMMQLAHEVPIGEGRPVAAHLSAGVHVLGPEDADAELVLQHAATALYQAKVDGKNALRRFTPEMDARMRARRELEQLLRDGLVEERFELHYQPLLDARNGSCVGMEALLRLRDRSGGLIPPIAFVPLAEQLGLIDDIGYWALLEATRVASTWPDPIFVSVNLSVKQFATGELLENVTSALEAAGLPARRLELEVTESLLMENTQAVAAQLKALKALGVSIAMDDFGTGYSSLAYLWQFGFDKLKIDRSFITALDVDPVKARELLDTIVMLAHKLDMKVTAEGIEAESQARVLSELACDQFQGYLYGRPAPAADLPAVLLRRAGAQLGKPLETGRPAATMRATGTNA